MDSPLLWKKAIEWGLADDQWSHDFTTGATVPAEQNCRSQVVAKSGGVWCADGLVNVVQQISEEMGMSVQVDSKIKNGSSFEPGQTLMEWNGSTRATLILERPFLNLASYFGGISTRTKQFVDLVSQAQLKSEPRVCLTRKTLPGWRDLSIHAVSCGGGYPHRASLSGGVLLKENHIRMAGGILPAVASALDTAPHGLKVEVEVRTLEELQQALEAKADGVLLDNFDPDQVRSAVQMVDQLQPRPFVEVSGGLSLEGIQSYLIEGVDVFSVGALTHSVTSNDLSLLIL